MQSKASSREKPLVNGDALDPNVAHHHGGLLISLFDSLQTIVPEGRFARFWSELDFKGRSLVGCALSFFAIQPLLLLSGTRFTFRGSRCVAGSAQARLRRRGSRVDIGRWPGGHGQSCFDRWAMALFGAAHRLTEAGGSLRLRSVSNSDGGAPGLRQS